MVLEQKTLKSIKSKLECEQKRLQKELNKLREYHDYGQSEDANAQEIEEFEGALALRKNLTGVLVETRTALQRLKEGNYGKCVICGEPIAKARLLVYPSTIYCIKDQPKARS